MKKYIFTWHHKDANGNIIGEIKRCIDSDNNKTDIPHYIQNSCGDFIAGTTDDMKSNGNPLFGLETIDDKTKSIIVCEGQKCAYALKELGYPCVTSILGANNANKTDWTPLEQTKTIYLMPDNDMAGESYTHKVHSILNNLICSPEMKIIRLPNLPNKGDICDWLKLHPELKNWNELDSLAKHHAKKTILVSLKKTIDSNLTPIPSEWNDWSETKPLHRMIPPGNKFPVDALGDVLCAAATKISEVIQAPLAICAQSIVASATLAAQGHADFEIDGRKKPLSGFFLTIGETGERKSAVDSVTLHPHREHQSRLIKKYENCILEYQQELEAYDSAKKHAVGSKHGSYEKKIEALRDLGYPPTKPLLPQIITEEPTYEGLVKLLEAGWPSIGLFSDEGGRFIGGHACNKDNLLKTAAGLCGLWDGKDISRVRSIDGATLLRGRRLSFHLMAQPIIAQIMLSNSLLLEQGLLSRCLVTWPKSTAGERPYNEINIYDTEEIKCYNASMKLLLEKKLPIDEGKINQLAPPSLFLSTNAKKLFVAFHDQTERKLQDGGTLNAVKGLANKAPEHATRLAGIIAIVENTQCTMIKRRHMDAGIKLMTFYLNEALRLFNAGHQDPELLLAEKLVRWLKTNNKGTVALVEIYQYGPNQIRDASTAKRLMNILVNHGYAKPEKNIIFDGKIRKDGWKVKID